MSGKKSALTAALAGGSSVSTVPAPAPKASSLGNLQAFPCLLQGEDGAADAGAVDFGDPHQTPIVGSLPTATTLPSGKQLVRLEPTHDLCTTAWTVKH